MNIKANALVLGFVFAVVFRLVLVVALVVRGFEYEHDIKICTSEVMYAQKIEF